MSVGYSKTHKWLMNEIVLSVFTTANRLYLSAQRKECSQS